ncbi:hypothetical protein IJG29_02125 [Candidatus Saccharibacteria bacterium]|nr:hypothetical protein [Candidatus Saccharibacteria bacterium]
MDKHRKRSKKWVWGVVFAVLVAVAAVIVYLVWDGYFKEKQPENKGEDKSSSTVEVVEKEPQVDEETEKVSKEAAQKAEIVYSDEAENEAKYDEITGVITYAGVAGDNLMIRVNIDQYVTGGQCELALRAEGGSVYSDAAPIIDAAATATCEGFNVPLAGLPSGELNIVIYLAAGDKTGEIRGSVNL